MSEDNGAPKAETSLPVGTRVVATRGPRRRRAPVEKVAVNLSAAAADRGARQAETRVDADDAPIDGDISEELAVENKHPDFEYAWLNAFALERFARRGYVQEKWGQNCARPKYYFGEQTDGEPIKYRELLLFKIPKTRMAKIEERSFKRQQHRQVMDVLQGRAPAAPNVNVSFTQQLVGASTTSR